MFPEHEPEYTRPTEHSPQETQEIQQNTKHIATTILSTIRLADQIEFINRSEERDWKVIATQLYKQA